VLAAVLEAIKAEQINVQEMENIIFDGAEAAVARINLDNAPSADLLGGLQASNADIIELDLLKLTNS
jgi:D-3-phosphoglycerate dehydrogenase